MKIKGVFLATLMALPGCATCQRHPVYCAIGAAVVVGTIAAVAEHHHDQQHQAVVTYCCGTGCPNRSNAVVGTCAP